MRFTAALIAIALAISACGSSNVRPNTTLSLSFEPNQGQTDPAVDFLSRGPGYTVFLSPTEAVLSLSSQASPAVVRMTLVGANPEARAAAAEPLPGKVNYLTGSDPSRWHTGIPTYAKASYRDVYRGVDVVYYGNERQLEYDFVVHPGASPAAIGLRFDGADRVEIATDGELVLHTAAGVVRNGRPRIYQLAGGRREVVPGSYVLDDRSQVGFAVGPYDASRPLVIDPTLVYSTYLGTAASQQSEDLRAIAVDRLGNAYVTGQSSAYFPTTSGAADPTNNGFNDVVVTKFNPIGRILLYSTYIGGSQSDTGKGIAVDAAGAAYVTGGTDSPDFPTSPGAFDTTRAANDAFVFKLNPSGSGIDYSTYLGGRFSESTLEATRIAVDSTGSAYVTGETGSPDFPTTPGAFDTTYNGDNEVFVTRLNPSGTALIYSTFLGGSSWDSSAGIALDTAGNVYVVGITGSPNFPVTPLAFDRILDGTRDGFLAKLDGAGSLVYATFLGGSVLETARSVAVDSAGNAYVVGDTSSPDFPTTAGVHDTSLNGQVYDGFVSKLNPQGSALLYSTFLGGSGVDRVNGVALDADDNAYLIGDTESADFPTARPLQAAYGGGFTDAFVAKMNQGGSALIYSTYVGGTFTDEGRAIAVDASRNAYAAGTTASSNFPTTLGSFDTHYNGGFDGFVMKIEDAGQQMQVTLGPAAASTKVSADQCVTATATDPGGRRVAGVAVRFEVTGAVAASGIATTNAVGQAEFCYRGALRPGIVDVQARPAP